MKNFSDLTIFLLTVIASSFILVLLLPYFIPIDLVGKYSSIFQNLGVGFGGVVGGIGGLNILKRYIEEREVKSVIKLLKEKYPTKEIGKSFDLVVKKSDPGRIFVRAESQKTIYHIGNYQTFIDLGFVGAKRTILEDKDFDIYAIGDPILTQGQIGT